MRHFPAEQTLPSMCCLWLSWIPNIFSWDEPPDEPPRKPLRLLGNWGMSDSVPGIVTWLLEPSKSLLLTAIFHLYEDDPNTGQQRCSYGNKQQSYIWSFAPLLDILLVNHTGAQYIAYNTYYIIEYQGPPNHHTIYIKLCKSSKERRKTKL